MLAVGIPRETKPAEKRVGLTPQGVRELRAAQISVWVEKGAGTGSGFSDQAYLEAGAEMVSRPPEVYERSGLIKKVKEPLLPEWKFLKPNLILFSFLHLASPDHRKLCQTLLDQKTIGIGYETMVKEGRTICLEPMSEMAGALTAYFAGFFKRSVRVENGQMVYPPRFLEKLEWLATHFPEVPGDLPPGQAVIFGGGVAGRKASEVILQMGGGVDLIEKREERRSVLKKEFQPFGTRFRVWGMDESFSDRLKEADVWIGCIHVAGERALRVLSVQDLEKFSNRRPKLILDIAIYQGGNFPESRSTTYENPLYLDSFGNLRFAVANIPSLCGRAASEAIEKVTLPYLVALAQDWKKALRDFDELGSGLQVFQGQLVNEAVARAHQLPWKKFDPSLL